MIHKLFVAGLLLLFLAPWLSATQDLYTADTGDYSDTTALEVPANTVAHQIKFHGITIVGGQTIDAALLCEWWAEGGLIATNARLERVDDQTWDDTTLIASGWNAQSTTDQDDTKTWNDTSDNAWGCINVTAMVLAMYLASEENVTIRVHDLDEVLATANNMLESSGLKLGDIMGAVNSAEDSDNSFGTGKFPYLLITYHSANTPPTYADYGWNVTNQSTFNTTTTFKTWAEWTDDAGISTAIFGVGGTNKTYATNSSENYSVAWGNLAAGSYAFYSCANDTANAWNCTPTTTFTINKASSLANQLLNETDDNVTYSFGNTVNASGSCAGGSLVLTRNGSVVSNPDINELAAGTYNYSVSCTGNENYTTTSEEHHAHVNKVAMPLTSEVNESSSDFNATVDEGFTWTCTKTYSEGTLNTQSNGTDVTVPFYNESSLVVDFNLTCSFNATGNFSAGSYSHWVHYSAVPPPPPANQTLVLERNGTAEGWLKVNKTTTSSLTALGSFKQRRDLLWAILIIVVIATFVFYVYSFIRLLITVIAWLHQALGQKPPDDVIRSE